MIGPKRALDRLWQSAPADDDRLFDSGRLAGLPETARRYLEHAIAPNTPLATAVRLKMHGQIKLKVWQPFRAEQVICRHQGMIWQATAWLNGLPITGWDRLIEGEGAMRWKLLGLFPVMKAKGPDITRSAVGRMQGEYVWLPSAFVGEGVRWTASDNVCACAKLTLLEETTDLHLTTNRAGKLQAAYFKRWGDPGESTPHYENFGVYVEEESTFSGYTIPTRLRAGWYFGSSRFASDGEFFRATIDEAIYR